MVGHVISRLAQGMTENQYLKLVEDAFLRNNFHFTADRFGGIGNLLKLQAGVDAN